MTSLFPTGVEDTLIFFYFSIFPERNRKIGAVLSAIQLVQEAKPSTTTTEVHPIHKQMVFLHQTKHGLFPKKKTTY
jgi:hypothetical protein